MNLRHDLIINAIDHYIENDVFESVRIITEEGNLFSDKERSNEIAELGEMLRIRDWAKSEMVKKS